MQMSRINEEKPDAAKTKWVEVVAYDPAWSLRFEEVREHLFSILSGQDVRVEHVGSTSVPGLAAKPILDIDIVLQKETNFEEVKALLEANGYHHTGDLGITGREVFKYRDKPELMRHNLYVIAEGADELKRHLTFRDWLRNHPQDREAYAQVKMTAAQQFPNDIDAYIDAKSDIIFEIYIRCGLYQPQGMEELARSVLNNRYALVLKEIDCKTLQPGILICQAQAAQGTFYLLAWEQACSASSELSQDQIVSEGGIALPLPSASGQQLCRTPYGMFALFGSEPDALMFLSSDLWKPATKN